MLASTSHTRIPLICAVSIVTSPFSLPFADAKSMNGVVSFDPVSQTLHFTERVGATDFSSSAGIVVTQGSFEDRIMETGWNRLTMETVAADGITDGDYFFALGFLEGHLTAQQVSNHVENLFRSPNRQSSNKVFDVPEVREFLVEQRKLASKSIIEYPHDPFWKNVGYMIRLMEGIQEGSKGTAHLSDQEIWAMNAWADLGDVKAALKNTTYSQIQASDPILDMDCSAVVRITPEEEMFVGHSDWATFPEMNKIYKHINFRHVADPNVKSHIISYTSRPATVSSIDDWYLMPEQQLAVTETTNSVLNTKLLTTFVKPDGIPASIRAMVANLGADGGKTWHDMFSRHNSGTQNNQWMIVNYAAFRAQHQDVAEPLLRHDILWVVEQVPSKVVGRDMTQTLETQGFWTSFNCAFFPEIRDLSGYTEREKRDPTWSNCQDARAPIMQRDTAMIADVEGVKLLLTSNNFEHEAFANGCPHHTVAGRYDILSPQCVTQSSTDAFGAIDAKVTSGKMMLMGASIGRVGPSRDGVPRFRWSTSNFSFSHLGLPDDPKFDFEYFATPWAFDSAAAHNGLSPQVHGNANSVKSSVMLPTLCLVLGAMLLWNTIFKHLPKRVRLPEFASPTTFFCSFSSPRTQHFFRTFSSPRSDECHFEQHLLA